MNKTLNYIFLSSILSGFVFWGVIFSPYLITAILSGIIPFDALVMLVIIIICSFFAGILIFLPAYSFLVGKLKINEEIIIIALASFISIVYVIVITGKVYDEIFYIAAALAGYSGGKLFHFLIFR